VEIVDAQVHVNRFPPDWRTAENDTDAVLDMAIAAMDAVGVNAVLVAESWTGEDSTHSIVLPNGAVRPKLSFSQRAVERFPGRFAYLASYDLRDPDLPQLIAGLRNRPGGLCLRVIPRPGVDQDVFEEGGFAPLFEAAQEHEVPIFIGMPAQAPLLEPYLQKFPRLWMILDHIGVGVTAFRGRQLAPALQSWVTPTLEGRLKELEFIIGLAK
jgi:predicted TIM-barrel fold metal-dependent hydrolase